MAAGKRISSPLKLVIFDYSSNSCDVSQIKYTLDTF